jgi:hypothetical protein
MTLKSQRKRMVKHENPEKFKAFVNAAESRQSSGKRS